MPDGSDAFAIDVLDRIDAIAAADWDACAGPGNPFLSHGFLSALEDSGSVRPDTGWAPRHLLVRDHGGAILAAAPFYVKGHSYGEYVFDWNWADAYQRAGGQYYPKLLCGVPFTPVPGPRLMLRPDAPSQAAAALAQGMVELAQRAGVSSVHVNFCSADEQLTLGNVGFLPRIGHQYHWANRGYGSFEDFLDDLSSRKRKAIKKERAAVAAEGLTIRALRGADLTEAVWDRFFAFYQDTTERKWGSRYLTRDFFSLLGERLADRVVLFLAERDGRAIAGALNLIGEEALFGRNWGCLEDIRFLHFELCYYQAIELAIELGLARVEAGAQGEHKIQRGYLPSKTYSAHWFRDVNFQTAVRRYLDAERPAIEEELTGLTTLSPFKTEP